MEQIHIIIPSTVYTNVAIDTWEAERASPNQTKRIYFLALASSSSLAS